MLHDFIQRYFTLVPTHLDRVSFYNALLPVGSSSAVREKSTHISRAKRYFLDRFRRYDAQKLLETPDAVLDRARFLFFAVREFDLMTMYERLAIKDAIYWPRPGGVSLVGTDLIRNFLLSYFIHEKDQLLAFERYWLPVETATAADRQGGNPVPQDGYDTDPDLLDALFNAFLTAVREEKLGVDDMEWQKAGDVAFFTPSLELRTPADQLGGVYAIMKRFIAAIIPQNAPLTAEQRQSRATTILTHLSKFAGKWAEERRRRQRQWTDGMVVPLPGSLGLLCCEEEEEEEEEKL